MKKSDAFKGNYLKAQHLIDGGPMRLTITGCGMEAMPDDNKEKPVLAFQEDKRGLVINQVNWDIIAERYGDDSDEWAGKTIELYPTKTQFGSKRVDCIRVRFPEFDDPIPDTKEKSSSQTELDQF